MAGLLSIHKRMASVLGMFALALTVAQAAAAGQERRRLETDAVALARRTIAARLAVPIERIRMVSVAPAQWRDSSLGCPERGLLYTPALASGYVVKLREAEREHVVHVAGGRAVVCGAQSELRLPSTTLLSGSLKAADAVRRALAARLEVEPERIRIVSVRPARPTRACAAAPSGSKGVAFIVDAESPVQSFRYYADDVIVVNCDESASKQPPTGNEKP